MVRAATLLVFHPLPEAAILLTLEQMEHTPMANVEKMSVEVVQRREQRTRAIEKLGRQWDEGLASGQAVDAAQAFERIREKLDAKLTAK